ncbi:hypothetical protein [Bacillus sp. JFL15]|uniref:hypothetical protein n=1 Tax=Bacillus sp. JFL15 TaxID=1679193 RepID=UPI00066FC0C0|nr:hypothetical protein [Bacillus sp. JFL15]
MNNLWRFKSSRPHLNDTKGFDTLGIFVFRKFICYCPLTYSRSYDLSVTFILLLTACGGSKYDNAINEVMKQEKKVRKVMRADSDEYKRDNAIICVYDDGSIFSLRFISQKKVLASLLLEKAIFSIKKSISIRGWIQYDPVPFCFQSDKRFSVKSFNNYWSIFLFQ